MGPSPTYHPPKGEECETSVKHGLPLWAEPAVGYCSRRPRPSPMWGSRFVGARAVGLWVGEQKPLGKSPLRGNPSPESTYLPTWWFEGDSAAFDKEIRGWSELCGWKCVTFHVNPGYVRREIEKEQEEECHNVLVRLVTSLFVPRRPRPDVGEQLNELHQKVDLLLDSALFGAAHR